MGKNKDPFGWRGERGRVKESRVELVKNMLILSQIHSTLLSLPPPQTKQTIKYNT